MNYFLTATLNTIGNFLDNIAPYAIASAVVVIIAFVALIIWAEVYMTSHCISGHYEQEGVGSEYICDHYK